MGDQELLILLKNQKTSENGFKILVQSYRENLYALIYRMTQNHDDTDDILQNTFIKVFKNINLFEAKSSLKTWMFRIATNETLNFLKSKKTHDTLDHLPTIVNKQHDVVMDADSLIKVLSEAIKSLPEKQRMVFLMRYYEEMGYEEMALITETSAGALKASYHHAVKKIETFISSKV